MGHDVFHTITPKQQNAEQQNTSSLQWLRVVLKIWAKLCSFAETKDVLHYCEIYVQCHRFFASTSKQTQWTDHVKFNTIAICLRFSYCLFCWQCFGL